MGLKPLTLCLFGFPEGLFSFIRLSFVFLVFSKVCLGVVKTFGKTKQPKQTNISKGGSETFKNLLVFPKVCLVFFSVLWYVWFSRRFCWLSKNLRENRQNKKQNKNISKGGSETFKHFVCLVFPKVFVVFFDVLWYVWFSRSFFKVVSMLKC